MEKFPSAPLCLRDVGPGFFLVGSFWLSDPCFFFCFRWNPRVSLAFDSLVLRFSRRTRYGWVCSERVATNHRKGQSVPSGSERNPVWENVLGIDKLGSYVFDSLKTSRQSRMTKVTGLGKRSSQGRVSTCRRTCRGWRTTCSDTANGRITSSTSKPRSIAQS